MDATTKITKNLGGDRLGSGSKNNISLHSYNRSTHDLSRAWRSSMTCGTLVPFMKEVALPGDTWSIDLEAIVRTIPTIGPLYGSFKLQLDVFECPMRLYNGLLHNNMTKIGMEMQKVKIPWLTINGLAYKPNTTTFKTTDYQISSDSLLKYLGISGIGDARNYPAGQDSYSIMRNFNAIPLLAYWDIVKNYYSNKQEEKAAYIGAKQIDASGRITELDTYKNGINTGTYDMFQPETVIPAGYTPTNSYQAINGNVTLEEGISITLTTIGGVNTTNLKLVINRNGTPTAINATPLFQNITVNGNQIDLTDYDGSTYLNDIIIGIDYVARATVESTIDIKTVDLSHIDNARIEVLKNTGLNNRVQIDGTWQTPYCDYADVTLQGDSANSLPMYGLALKTYQSDLFENWMKTEWIDGPNGINAITAVDTSIGSFQIDALNLANKVYNMLNRIAVSGGSYEDYIEAVYSIEANRRPESPVYKGGMSSEIVFEEVVATAQTDKPLGTLGGKGTIANKRGGHVEIRVNEPSYIMGIISITPRIDYSQGNDWDVCELDTMADLHKPALDGIGFEDLLQERMAWFGTYYDISNQRWRKLAAGKVPAHINYMTAVNKSYGDFAKEEEAMFMTLNRRYEPPTDLLHTGIQDLTTYIDPRKYNYNFAESNLQAQNFWVQIGAKVEVRRVMSAKIIPNL